MASLQDSHDEFLSPSDFEAWLHMDIDIYDGKVLIGYIDPDYLPRTKYPFDIGDEIVSVDGTPINDLVKAFIPYAVNGSGNKTSQMRLAAGAVFDRVQEWNPRAGQISDDATVVIRRQNGNVETYMIPWDKIGTAFDKVGPVPSPQFGAAGRFTPRASSGNSSSRGPLRGPQRGNPWGIWNGPPAAIAPDPVPDYMQALRKLEFGGALAPLQASLHASSRSRFRSTSAGIFPFENPFPAFDPPAGFKLRLGARSTDQFISGTFPVGNKTVGYIRIPTMAPPSQSTAFNQFANEIIALQQLTDGLVVDVMANGGGSGCYAQALAAVLIPHTFRGLGVQLRATSNWVASFSFQLEQAKAQGAPDWVITLYGFYLDQVKQANSEFRGMTGPLPICGALFDQDPLKSTSGTVLSYTKPILVLTDNYTLSAAEIFTMFMQDSQRATIFGTRTDGGGGSVLSFDATDYSEGVSRVTLNVITRAQPVATPDFPAGPYSIFYEAQGIYPDIVEDFQTKDNLLNFGATFVEDFSAAICEPDQQVESVGRRGLRRQGASLLLEDRHVLAVGYQVALGHQAKAVGFHFLDQVVLIQADVLQRSIARAHRAAPLEVFDDHQLAIRQQAVADVFEHGFGIVEMMIDVQDQHAG